MNLIISHVQDEIISLALDEIIFVHICFAQYLTSEKLLELWLLEIYLKL